MKKIAIFVAMKRLFFVICLLGVVGMAAGQTNVSETKIPDFYGITLSGDMNVELIEADRSAIEVILYESAIDKIHWSVSDSVLAIRLRPTVGKKSRADVRVFYGGKELREVTATQARVSSEKPLTSHCLIVTVSSGGSARLNVDARDFELVVNGNSEAEISGKSKYLTVRATERAEADVRKLSAVSADVEAATTAQVHVNAGERLVAKARSGAKIFWDGKPSIMKTEVGFGAGIYHAGERVKN